MEGEIVAIVERLFKAFIFVPCMALIAWWLFSAWLDSTLTLGEAAVGTTLLAGAFLVGVVSIVSGGWGFLGVLGFIYLALLGILAWEYIYWRRRERQHLLKAVETYEAAIESDPQNAAAYSFLGKTLLALRRVDEAVTAIERAVALDPESKKDGNLLRDARAIQARLRPRSTRGG